MRLFERSLSALARDLFVASRPLSLSLALYAVAGPAALAYRAGLFGASGLAHPLLRLMLVLFAGLAIQAATNFINDYFECGQKQAPRGSRLYRFLGRERDAFDILIFFSGTACFGAAGLVGLWLMATGSPQLLWVGIAGLIGGYCYTGEPVVYKRLGLGAILSFALMGPLMNLGAWLAFGGEASPRVILLTLPISLLIPAMMLSNELRDVDRDSQLGIKTLTVRLGRKTGLFLYDALLVSAFALVGALSFFGAISPYGLLALAAAPLAYRAHLRVAKGSRDAIPATNILHLSFGLLYIAALAV